MDSDAEEGTVIDRNACAVRRSIHISAPIEKVWAALTQPELISTWFTQSAVLYGDGVGSTGFFTFSPTNWRPDSRRLSTGSTT